MRQHGSLYSLMPQRHAVAKLAGGDEKCGVEVTLAQRRYGARHPVSIAVIEGDTGGTAWEPASRQKRYRVFQGQNAELAHHLVKQPLEPGQRDVPRHKRMGLLRHLVK